VADPLETRPTLLERARDLQDQAAWEELCRAYLPLIHGYARQRGCSEAMAADVVQETLLTLARKLPEFEYDRDKGQFRSYLLTIVTNHIRTAFRRERRYVELDSGEEEGEAASARIPAPEQPPPGDNWDRQWDINLYRLALGAVRERVDATVFESFVRYGIRREPAAEVAADLDCTINAIYQHRNRLVRMLSSEVAQLRREYGDEPPR